MRRDRPRRRARLRTKVLAGVLSIMIAAFAGFDLVAVAELRRYLLGQTDTALQAVLNLSRLRLDKLLARAENGHRPVQLERNLGGYYLAYVSDAGSVTILETRSDLQPRIPSDLAAIAADRHAETVAGRGGDSRFRLRAQHVDGGTLIAGADLDRVDRTVRRLRLIVVIGSAVAVMSTALGVVLVVRRGLRPLEAMADQADRISAGDLSDRVRPHDPRSEIGRLGAALNGMLARIDASVGEREADRELMRRFFADASHELRTPLASLRANAELYRLGALPDRPHVDETMRRIELEARRMGRLVDDMFRLAQLDQRPERRRGLVDLTAVLNGCVERARIADPRRTWRDRIAADLVTVGDDGLLRSVIDNLIGNVQAHTPAGTTTVIEAVQQADSIVIDVSDDGPGVSADELPRLFDRFFRAAGRARMPGAGLGLAIVNEVVTTHGGNVQATSNRPGGLRVSVTLPAANSPLPSGEESSDDSGGVERS